jgi:phytoene dehydrogenase-like protein
MTPTIPELPVVVIGAGPVGLAAAVHLLDKGATPLVLEAGDGVGAMARPSFASLSRASTWPG